MRLPTLIIAFYLVGALPANAAPDARVTFLTRQLRAARDVRVKSQTVLLLGQTGTIDAVEPLCGALSDAEAVVQTGAANALGALKQASATACLAAKLKGEPDDAVRTAVEKAIASLEALARPAPGPSIATALPGAPYVQLEAIVDRAGLGSDAALATSLLRESVLAAGAYLAPEGEEKKAAHALIKAKKLKGYQVRLQLLPGVGEQALKVEMLVLSYPDQALQGSWNVKASGGDAGALLKAMVPRVVEDAAGDLNWKNEGGQ